MAVTRGEVREEGDLKGGISFSSMCSISCLFLMLFHETLPWDRVGQQGDLIQL